MITVHCHAVSLTVGSLAFMYRVEYYLEGTRVSTIESSDLKACLDEVERKMKMDMAHVKGKVFTTQTGREL